MNAISHHRQQSVFIRLLKRMGAMPLTEADGEAGFEAILARMEKHPGTKGPPCSPRMGKRVEKAIQTFFVMAFAVGVGTIFWARGWTITIIPGGGILMGILVGVAVGGTYSAVLRINPLMQDRFTCRIAQALGMPLPLWEAHILTHVVSGCARMQDMCVKWVAYNHGNVLTQAEWLLIQETSRQLNKLMARMDREEHERTYPDRLQAVLEEEGAGMISRGKALAQKQALEDTTCVVATPGAVSRL